MGSHLCPYLEAQGHTLIRLNSKNCDLTKQDSLLKFNDQKYDYIYHLAAWTQAGDFCLYHAGEQWIINQQINTNVLTWWQKYQPQAKLIAIGTSCAYDPDLEPVEENYLKGEPIKDLLTYAMTKRMLYVGQMAIHTQFGLKYLHVVPDTLYGPGYHTDGRQLHFIFNLIREIMRAKFYGAIAVVFWGDGHQKRELVFIEDFVKILVRLVETDDDDIVNVAPGEQFSIRYFAKLICNILEYDYDKLRADSKRYVGATSKFLSPKKLQTLMPNIQWTPLDIGLKKTIEWCLQNKEKFLEQAKP